MTFSQCLKRRVLRFVSLFLTILIVVGFTAVLQVEATPDSSHSQTTIVVVRKAVAIPVVTADRLPPEARSTIHLIRQGGPYPYAKDGTVFRNRERRLPQARTGYYREYTVKTPGERNRGARRIITGQKGELYYTGDHYASFVRVQ
ncbi:MAG: guanyl-specific ribonuclease Sa [Tildeniella nuda ZEHNDER 1965/U140]|nr:guanyl-specific ribonuclease Sa [Tildeniella nuda ZEHNDER 1965/U140]